MKKHLILLLAFAMVLSLAACGASPAESPATTSTTVPAEFPTEAPTEKTDAPDFYALGDKMDDFTITLTDGKEMTLSEILKTKEMVFLNFWATWCGPCKMEFPYMEEAYLAHQDKVEVIALSVEPSDTNEVLEAFKAELGLKALPMGSDSLSMYDKTGSAYIPTSMIIDRFGVICWMDYGSITSTEKFERLFDCFLGEDYTESRLLDKVPGPAPTVANPENSALRTALNAKGSEIVVTNDEDPLAWPFLPTADGSLKSSNAGVDETSAKVHATVPGKAGDVLSVDITISSEGARDFLELYVDGELVDVFSGEESCTYAYAFTTDADHTVTFAYCKDGYTASGEDCAIIDNLCVLNGDAAAAALAAQPIYPLTLNGTESEIVPVTGKKVVLTTSGGEIISSDISFYVIGESEATFSVKLGKDLNPKLAVITVDSFTPVPVNTLEQTEDGFLMTIPLDSLETCEHSFTSVEFYPDVTGSPDGYKILVAFANENNLDATIQMLYSPEENVSWSYDESTGVAAEADGPATYQVRFVDQNGKPVVGVMAQVCDESTCEVIPSDAEGKVTFERNAYPYEIHVLKAPEGYSFDTKTVHIMPSEGGEIVIQGTKN